MIPLMMNQAHLYGASKKNQHPFALMFYFTREGTDCPLRVTVSIVSIAPTLLHPSYTDIAPGKRVINFDYSTTLIFLYNKFNFM